MGKITSVAPVETLVKNTVDTFLKDATQTYPSFLETAPIFVTYYSRSAFKSTYDTSFEAYNEIVGEESPNKFHKIENLPLYSLDTADFGTEMGEDGWSGEVSSSGIILPDTVKPKPDDLIELSIHSKKYLFQVTNGTADNFGNNKFYKINFRLSQYTKAEVERETVEEFKVDYTLIGKQANTLVKKSFVEHLDTLRSTFDNLLSGYNEEFFSNYYQCFANSHIGLIDQNLNHFMISNGLTSPFINYRNSITVNPTLSKLVNKKEFKESFFYDLEKNNYINIINNLYNIVKKDISNEKYSLNYFVQNKFGFTKYNDIDTSLGKIDFSFLSDENFNSNDPNLKFIFLFGRYFINNNNLTSDDATEFSKTGEEELEEILEAIGDLEIRYNDFSSIMTAEYINDYYLTPIILFALKQLFELITKP